ncbi:hypothetical protein [Pseudobacteroides cellulosolvens]|uniref:Uncharacterized protein n=2 Tax=Pseudobacteroides cellulosolvens TaxID=35825 RepID=A0A0L6JPY8_9FIRM|nr:hypothetical protein [Pseudobacteroides cellulosolvens]KNY27906.1 hypothetical protein Bccel_3177 [Pseudobacteroides cellulosolvens ATCC 35603 = DSM 2933]
MIQKTEGIFKKFNGNVATQIEFLDYDGRRIREYCNKETQYYLDDKLIEKSSFTEGIKIVVETKNGDLFIKNVWGYKDIEYIEVDEFQKILEKYLCNKKGFYATGVQPV